MRYLLHVRTVIEGFMPFDDFFDGVADVPARPPAKIATRFTAIEFEVSCFMRLRLAVDCPGCALAPALGQAFNDPLYRFDIVIVWAKIPAFCVMGAFRMQFFCQHQITAQGFEYVLPGANRMRAAD